MKYLVILLLIAGCATTPAYEWRQTHKPASMIRWWQHETYESLIKACGRDPRPERRIGKWWFACAPIDPQTNICEIQTIHTPIERMWSFDADGLSEVEHEEKHCAGWSHQ